MITIGGNSSAKSAGPGWVPETEPTPLGRVWTSHASTANLTAMFTAANSSTSSTFAKMRIQKPA